jgi:hypothetical protein
MSNLSDQTPNSIVLSSGQRDGYQNAPLLSTMESFLIFSIIPISLETAKEGRPV